MSPLSTESPVRYWFPKPYADFVQRLRVPAGFLLLVTFAGLSSPSAASLTVGMPVCVVGLLLRAWASGHLAKNETLAISGPYALMRNPLYLGTLLTAFGIVLASRSWGLASIFATVFFLVYLPAVELEEQHLRKLFPDYESYAARVGRFFPRTRVVSGNRNFSFVLYRRNQEYKAAAGFLVALAWLIWKFIGFGQA
jgi:protein-S-isoprenylcysteine O-methyltransferase Ste14